MQIVRTEPTTGGPTRTPRELVEPVFGESDEVELDQAIDASSSEGWPDSAGPGHTTWEVQMAAIREYLVASDMVDSQEKSEQEGGSDEMGGTYSAFFNHDLIRIGVGDDGGDLNPANFDRKVQAIRVRDEHGQLVPLPYGGTAVMSTIRYLDRHYLLEFAKDKKTGLIVPASQRPRRGRVLWTDGAMSDYQEFGHRLTASHAEIAKELVHLYPELAELVAGDGDLWPDEQWFGAILGRGDGHAKALALYQGISKEHHNVHTYSFEGVFNGAEIAEDVAVGVLARK